MTTTSHILPTWFHAKLLRGIRRGIEKEGLRMDADGYASCSMHPLALGSKLTHPSITTDYSENLLELITEPFDSIADALNQLRELHIVVQTALPKGELIWPLSMPCLLSDDDSNIPLADYGTSNIGQLKTLYRSGLGVRYGRKMQTIAGIHYNFSVGDNLFEVWRNAERGFGSLSDFKNDKYLSLIRNFKRLMPMVLYLTGASPSVCASFIKGREHHLTAMNEAKTSYYAPYATSLRMGKLGYTNSVQDDLDIRYNHLAEYIKGLRAAIHTPYEPFSAIGVDDAHGKPIQINDHILQIENEYYSPIRPKQVTQSGENPSDALSARGIGYVEFRAIDLNPYVDIAIDINTACLLEILAIYCILAPSQALLPNEDEIIAHNIDVVVNKGRADDARILATHLDGALGESLLLTDWLHHHLSNMQAIAQSFDECMGGNAYAHALTGAQLLVDNPNQTPSARIIADSQHFGSTWLLGAMLGRSHQSALLDTPLDEACQAHYQNLADWSLAEQKRLEDDDAQSFYDYLQAYRQFDKAADS